MSVSEITDSETISWKAYFGKKLWFSCELIPAGFTIVSTSDPGKADTLRNLFQTIQILNPDFRPKAGTCVETVLETNPEWGFGSSSTLVSLLSQWAEVNPYQLNELVFKGSGFDIACADSDGPVFYTKNLTTQAITLDYPFSENLFLGYSGRKLKTLTEVNSFQKNQTVTDQQVQEISLLTDEFARCTDQREFNRLIVLHEELVGKIIGKIPVKEAFFSDFDGEIKSLGAWGGDFFLISSSMPFSDVTKYFEPKGINPVLKWSELILNRKSQ